jgi:hypothetical protein
VVSRQDALMPRPTPHSHAVSALSEAIVERIEAAYEISTEAHAHDRARQRQRWLSLIGAGHDIAALARALEILSRPQ